MEKRSRVLIIVVVLALITSIVYSYYRYIVAGDFLIDESQVEAAIEAEEMGETGELPADTLPTEEATESAEMDGQ